MRFDWSTLILQTINVLVLLWLLQRFLFRPVVDIIVARRDAAEQMLGEAAAARKEAETKTEEAARYEKKLTADNDRILTEARAAAEAERQHLLALAKDQAEQAREAAHAALGRERDQMRRDLEKDARNLAVSIAVRLLGRVPVSAVNTALLQSLGNWLANLPPERLQALAQPEDALEVVTSSPLDVLAQAACTTMLAEKFGHTPTLGFATDPSLIAGVELRSSHARLSNNWRADLDRIAQELGRDDEPRAMA
jgi:F-type H+-transporting ATPase subunit b